VANFIMAYSSYPALSRHPKTNRNGPRSVADLHTVKVKSLAVVALDVSVATTIVKRCNETGNLDQLAIVP
jgi:hypothetical protein